MSYNPTFEASKALPVEHIARELEDFVATGQDLSRRRFSRSPPRVPSVPSTQFEESEPPSPTAQLQDKETKELRNSTADAQYWIQTNDELDRLRAARDKNLLEHPQLFDLEEAAEANVKYRWIQQGIWDEQWESQPLKIWKHELQHSQSPMKPSYAVKEGGVASLQRDPKRKLLDLKEEYYDIVRGAVEYQDRQSSRPCYQFLYQWCQEREWIKWGLSYQDKDQGEDRQTNIDVRAYEVVKSRWTRDGIWDDDWTSIPGTSWRHKHPQKTPDPRGMYQEKDKRRVASIERAERPARWYPVASTPPLMRIKWPPRPLVSLHTPEEYKSPRTNSAESSIKKRPSTKKGKNESSTALVKQKGTLNTASRPRRAAALKALRNIAKTT